MDTKETISKEKLMSLFHVEHRMSFGRGITTSLEGKHSCLDSYYLTIDIEKLGGKESLLGQLSLSSDFNKNMLDFNQKDAEADPK